MPQALEMHCVLSGHMKQFEAHTSQYEALQS